jgi:glycosyltransferase involved in cell wall biosynthesis
VKILSVSDYAADSRYGGAEMNTMAVLEDLRAQGHEVEDLGLRHLEGNIYQRTGLPDPVRLNHGRIILGNATTLDPRWLYDLVRIHSDRLVLWIHDAPWCGFRAGCCGGKYRPEHVACNVPRYLPLMRKARRVLFYTPMQRGLADAMFGTVPEGRSSILPLFCDSPRSFLEAAKTTPRVPGTVLAVGRMSPAKGADMFHSFAARNRGRYKIKAIGRCADNVKESFEAVGVEMLPHIDHASLPAQYAAAEYFFHQPPQMDAGPRTVIEARLAGCRLLVSEACGLFSHPAWALDDEALTTHCEGAVAATAAEVLR